MDIFDGLRWCKKHPGKKIMTVGYHSIWFNVFDIKFKMDTKTFPCNFDINHYPTDGDYSPIIEKLPLSDLFDKWIDGEKVYCTWNDKEWIVSDACLRFYLNDNVSNSHNISPEIAKLAIWYTKDGE